MPRVFEVQRFGDHICLCHQTVMSTGVLFTTPGHLDVIFERNKYLVKNSGWSEVSTIRSVMRSQKHFESARIGSHVTQSTVATGY